VVLGSQTALVVGPSGEEIYTDDDGYGRVKVQFHWDRENEYDEKSSCWIRVSQGWAGGNYGMIFLPRVGQEVIVDFLEGNPDYPIITGRVYNHDNMPPYGLPAEKTKSTIKTRTSKEGGGFNELRFEDKKDSEQIFMHGQKDLDIRILNDEKDWIGRDKHEIIEGNQKKRIGGSDGRGVGGDQLTKIGGNRCIKIGGGSIIESGSHYKVEAGGDIVIGAPTFKLVADGEGGIRGATLVIMADSLTLKSGGSFVTLDAGGVSISGPMVKINSGGAAGSVGSSSAVSMVEPGDPLEAATGDPGKDFTYSQQPVPYEPFEHAPIHNEDDATEEQTHWIGVRLLDDNGQPLAGERYVIQLPDGTKVARGYTDKEGKVEVKGIDPGSCEIAFPDLDGATWEPGPPPDAAGGGAGGGSGTPGGNGVPGGGGGLPGLP
jgi:type VI secretion system secreted protein VgrG